MFTSEVDRANANTHEARSRTQHAARSSLAARRQAQAPSNEQHDYPFCSLLSQTQATSPLPQILPFGHWRQLLVVLVPQVFFRVAFIKWILNYLNATRGPWKSVLDAWLARPCWGSP
eukprot:scaffold5603_cov125-Isochrysis_galbana.AAC.4